MRPRRSFRTRVWWVSARPSSQGSPADLMDDKRRRPRAAGITADQDFVGMRLGHARGHRADSHFGDQLHGDVRGGVGVFQIKNELRQIFNGINVMMRRR